MIYILFAVLSACFAALTTILAKCGLKNSDPDGATSLRTLVALIVSWIVVFITDSFWDIKNAWGLTLLWLILSGVATGASWICYFKALKFGDANKVSPIDKSSTVLAMIMSFVFLNEEPTLFKLIAMALIFAGTLMMTVKSGKQKQSKSRIWIVFAWLSALFAALTSIFAKVGIENINSNLATALRTVVVLIMAWVVMLSKGKRNPFSGVGGAKEKLLLILSGISTGASWLCYYYALGSADLTVVVAIDKLSILPVVLFSALFLKEKLSAMASAGLVLICAGTILTVI